MLRVLLSDIKMKIRNDKADPKRNRRLLFAVFWLIPFMLFGTSDAHSDSDQNSCVPIKRLPSRLFGRARSWRHGRVVHFSFLCGKFHQLADDIPESVRCDNGTWMDGKRPVEINSLLSGRHICVALKCHVDSVWKSVLPLSDSYKPILKITLQCPANQTLTDYYKSRGGQLVCQKGGTWNMNLTGNLQLCRDMTAADFRTPTTAMKHKAATVVVHTSPSVLVVNSGGLKTSTTRIRVAPATTRASPTTTRVAATTTRVSPTTTSFAPTASRVAPNTTTMSAFIRRLKEQFENEMRKRGQMPPYEATGGKDSPEHCEKPDNHLGAKWLNPGPIRIGRSAVFVCDEGYAFENGRRFFVTTCSPADGKLSAKTVPKCKAINQCNRLNLANTVATPNSTFHPVGKVVVYSCLDGYWFGDGARQRHIQCGQDGQWDTKITEGCKEAKKVTLYHRTASGAEKWNSCVVIIVPMLLLLIRLN